MLLWSSGNGGSGVGPDARCAKGSAELTWLGCKRKLENIFLLQWFGFPCLSSEADVLYVSLWVFGLCQEQLVPKHLLVSTPFKTNFPLVHNSPLLTVSPQAKDCHKAFP